MKYEAKSCLFIKVRSRQSSGDYAIMILAIFVALSPMVLSTK